MVVTAMWVRTVVIAKQDTLELIHLGKQIAEFFAADIHHEVSVANAAHKTARRVLAVHNSEPKAISG